MKFNETILDLSLKIGERHSFDELKKISMDRIIVAVTYFGVEKQQLGEEWIGMFPDSCGAIRMYGGWTKLCKNINNQKEMRIFEAILDRLIKTRFDDIYDRNIRGMKVERFCD